MKKILCFLGFHKWREVTPILMVKTNFSNAQMKMAGECIHCMYRVLLDYYGSHQYRQSDVITEKEALELLAKEDILKEAK